MSNAKHWMFTLNNPTEEADYLIRALPYKYCIYSYEMGTSGTVHIQGSKAMSPSKVARSLVSSLRLCLALTLRLEEVLINKPRTTAPRLKIQVILMVLMRWVMTVIFPTDNVKELT